MDNPNSTTVEVDLMLLLKKLWSRKFLILLVSILMATLALLVSIFLITPKYTSTTRLYVVNTQRSSEDVVTAQDLQAGSYLTKDYKEIITSKDVMSKVTSAEKNELTESELTNKLSVSIPTDTRVISISIEDENPEVAAKLANEVREVAAEKIKDVTKVDEVTTLEVAEPSSKPSSPNIKRNIMLGFLAGAFLSVVGVLLSEILDDTVKRAEDVEEVLGVVLLGVVPNTDKL